MRGFELGAHAAAAAFTDRAGDREHLTRARQLADQRGIGVDAGVAVVDAVDVAEQDQQVGVDQVGDERGERVVFAERAAAQLFVGDDIVLVDDRHDAEAEQAQQGVADVEIAEPLGDIGAGDQGLRGGQIVALEELVVALDEMGLADRGEGLALADAGLVAARAHAGASGGDGAAGHDRDLGGAGAQLGDLAHEVFEHQRVEPITAASEQIRAEFRDHALRALRRHERSP